MLLTTAGWPTALATLQEPGSSIAAGGTCAAPERKTKIDSVRKRLDRNMLRPPVILPNRIFSKNSTPGLTCLSNVTYGKKILLTLQTCDAGSHRHMRLEFAMM